MEPISTYMEAREIVRTPDSALDDVHPCLNLTNLNLTNRFCMN